MFIIAFNNGNNISEVSASDANTVMSLANILENNKIVFTVSDRTGKLEPKVFNANDFQYWKTTFFS